MTFYLTESTSNIIKTLLPTNYQNRNGFNKVYSLNEIQKAQQELIENLSFSGMLITKTRVARNRLNYQKNILEYVIKIINEIESELNHLEE